jgi:hypothetical protein
MKRALLGCAVLATTGCIHHAKVHNLEFARTQGLREVAEYTASNDRQIAPFFLRLAGDPEIATRLRTGEVVARPSIPDAPSSNAEIQHWVGAIFVPNLTLNQAIPALENYSNRKRYMAPDITESRELKRSGDRHFVYLQFAEHSIISGVFDVFLDIRHHRIAPSRLSIESRSTGITDVTKSVQQDRGLLWALNHSWRLEEKDGGLYIECEALVLSRRPPSAIRFLVDRFIAQAARKTLVDTLTATRRMITDTSGTYNAVENP